MAQIPNTDNEIASQVQEVLKPFLKISENSKDFSLDASLRDAGLDAWNAVSVLIRIQNVFNITFPQEVLSEDIFSTARTLQNFVIKYIGKA